MFGKMLTIVGDMRGGEKRELVNNFFVEQILERP